MEHDIRFVEDDWESPTLGAWGLGWRSGGTAWRDSIHIFSAGGGFGCDPCRGVDLRRRASRHVRSRVENVYDLDWNGLPKDRGGVSYGDVFHRAEVEYSHYNFNLAETDALFKLFEDAERECLFLLKAETSQVLPAYDQCIKASHRFNLLDSRGVISATERQAYIGRVRTLAKSCCESWLKSRGRPDRAEGA